jgi:hypothetical protein
MDKVVYMNGFVYDGKSLTATQRAQSKKRLLFIQEPAGDLLTDVLTIGLARVEQVERMRKKYGEHPDPRANIQLKPAGKEFHKDT